LKGAQIAKHHIFSNPVKQKKSGLMVLYSGGLLLDWLFL
jgi:hypothetical protein